MANEAVSALDPTSSDQQIQAALNTVTGILQRDESRNLMKIMSATQADITTPQGVNKLGEALTKNGYTFEQAVGAIRRLKVRLGGP